MRILCAVDGSECSQWGVQALEALAGRESEAVTLLHVVDPSALRAGRGRNPVAEKRALAAMRRPAVSSSARQSVPRESPSDRPRPARAPRSTAS